MKHLQVMGITAVAASVALTGCSGSKAATASDVKGGPAAAAKPSPTVSATSTARPGAFCSKRNAMIKNTQGTVMKCTGKSGQRHWAVVTGPTTHATTSPHARSTSSPRAGAYCSPQGSTVKTRSGTTYTCTKKSGQSQPHWVKK